MIQDVKSIYVLAGRKKLGAPTNEVSVGAEATANKLLYQSDLTKVAHCNLQTGNNANPGTAASPKKTLDAALGLVNGVTIFAAHCQTSDTYDMAGITGANAIVQAPDGVSPIIIDRTKDAGIAFEQRFDSTVTTFDAFATDGVKQVIGFYRIAAVNTLAISNDYGKTFTTSPFPDNTAPVGSQLWRMNNRYYLGLTTSGSVKVYTSLDGQAWQSVIFDNNAALNGSGLTSGVYGNGVYLIFNSDGGSVDSNKYYRSTDGFNFTRLTFPAQVDNVGANPKKTLAAYNGTVFAVVANANKVYSSPDGITWTLQATIGGLTATCLRFGLSTWVIGGTGIYTSPDLITWTARAAGGGGHNGMVFTGTQFITQAISGAFIVTYRTYDGTTWFNGGNIMATATFTEFGLMGHVSGIFLNVMAQAATRRIYRSGQYFDTNVTFYGIRLPYGFWANNTVTTNQCTVNVLSQTPTILGTLAALVLNYGNNAGLRMRRTIVNSVDGDAIKSVIAGFEYASQECVFNGTVQVTVITNTVAQFISNYINGAISINNSAANARESFIDNIINGSLTGTRTSPLITVFGGNFNGSLTNAQLNSDVLQLTDPVLDSLYRPQRISGYDNNGTQFPFDSRMVAASQYFTNSVGARRDIGPWSFNDSQVAYAYTRQAQLPKGKSITSTIENMVYQITGMSGAVDVYNDTSKRVQRIDISWDVGIEREFLEFWEYLESLTDTNVWLSIDPQNTITLPSATANGAQAAGLTTLTINTLAYLPSGCRVTVGQIDYYVVYPLNASDAVSQRNVTKLVLDRPLAASVSNGQSVILRNPYYLGEFLYVPNKERRSKRQEEHVDLVYTGLNMSFIRKLT